MTTTRRDEILSVATALFARHGYRHTTLDAIAGACGLGKTAIYHYFDGKQAIFAAAVDTISDNVLEAMRKAAKGPDDPVEAIIAASRARFETLRQLSQAIGVPNEIAQELGRLSIEARDRFYEGEIELLEELLRRANEAGVTEIESPSDLAHIISAMFRGVEDMLSHTDWVDRGTETMIVAVDLVADALRASVRGDG